MSGQPTHPDLPEYQSPGQILHYPADEAQDGSVWQIDQPVAAAEPGTAEAPVPATTASLGGQGEQVKPEQVQISLPVPVPTGGQYE